jgi:hypothetical protein
MVCIARRDRVRHSCSLLPSNTLVQISFCGGSTDPSATTLHRSANPHFVIPPAPACRGSELRISTTLLSSTAMYAAFFKESRMKSTETTKPDRKSGGSRGTCCCFSVHPIRQPLIKVTTLHLSSRLPRRAAGAYSGFPTTLLSLTATYAAFSRESRMKFTNATRPDRKSGGSRGTCCAP